ncbi:hypothetical protein ACFLWZ_07050 [Chloroflexota bacterium]
MSGPTGDTGAPDVLSPGEVWTYTASGTATAGQYSNEATVTADDPVDTEVTDSDPSHYFGSDPDIDIEKATNGQDADSPTGPYIGVGDAVTWTYVVTNTGNVDLDNVVVTDSPAQTISGPTGDDGDSLLNPGEAWTYTASGTATAGQYSNEATVTADDPEDTEVTDSDPSHYFGSEPGIQIEKATNGEDADNPTGPFITPGSTVTWTYIVTNTSAVALSNVVVTDDNGTPGDTSDDFNPTFVGGDTNGDDKLDITETWTYTASGTAIAGQYENWAIVTASDPGGLLVGDNDPSHYFGPVVEIEIIKTVSLGHNGCGGFPGIELVPGVIGDPITYYFEVINNGNIQLNNITIDDAVLGNITRSDMTLCTGLSDEEPLAPVERLVFYYETNIEEERVNVAITSGTPWNPSTGQATGQDNPIDDDDAAVSVEECNSCIELMKEYFRNKFGFLAGLDVIGSSWPCSEVTPSSLGAGVSETSGSSPATGGSHHETVVAPTITEPENNEPPAGNNGNNDGVGDEGSEPIVDVEDEPAVEDGLASIDDYLISAYSYQADEGIEGWTVFNPAWPAVQNSLETLYMGRGYWINVSQDCTLEWGSNTYELNAGWNLIGWLGS